MMNTMISTPNPYRTMSSQQPHTPTPRQGSSSNVHQRRGPPPMISHASVPQQLSQVQIQQQQAAARAIELEQAKRRSRKPTDKTISDEIQEICPMVSLYNDVRRVEKRVDAAIMRKRLDIADAVNRTVKNYKTLRVWVSNTAINQPWQATSRLDENSFDFDTGLIPSYRMRIEGRFLDDDDNDDTQTDDEDVEKDETEDTSMEVDGQIQKPNKSERLKPFANVPKPSRKFSKFIKAVTVEVDRSSFDNLNESSSNVEWIKYPTQSALNKPPATAPAEFDAIDFERKLDLNSQCTIKIVRDEQPERFKLSPALADLLDTAEDTKGGVVVGIWEYILLHDLQDKDEKRMIICDEKMQKVFNQERVYFPSLPDLAARHCTTIPPITFTYNIRVDVASAGPLVYDIMIPTEDPIRARMSALITSPIYAQSLRTLMGEDDNIAMIIQSLNHSKAKRDFWTSLKNDPATFINRWVASQKKDLEIILGDRGVDSEESRRAGFYSGDVVAENAYLLLHGKDVPVGMRG